MKTTLIASFASLLGIASVNAALISQQSGAWSDPNTWDGVNVPQMGDDIEIQHNITLGGSTPSLNSLTMTSGSLTVSGWNTLIEATTVTLNSGNLTHAVQSDTSGTRNNYVSWTPDARVWIRAVDVTVGGAASINVNQAGYLGGWYVSSSDNSGGKGFGSGSGNNSQGGAGYGGRGAAKSTGERGLPYGDFFQADDPGSGGGVHTSNIGNGGNGGGNIRIEATGTVQIDGNLTANGGNNVSRGGAGSGGGVFIQAGTLTGSGSIAAGGGTGTYTTSPSGSGSGGRIAITAAASSYTGSIAVNPGTARPANDVTPPQYGTLFSLTGEPTAGATSTIADGTPQLNTSLSATSGENGVQLLREIVEWTTSSMIWTDDSRDMLGNSLNNTATYTLSGLTPNFGYYQVFVDGTNIFGGFVGSDGAGMLPGFNVALGSPHDIMVVIPEPASGLILALAGLFGLRRRRV